MDSRPWLSPQPYSQEIESASGRHGRRSTRGCQVLLVGQAAVFYVNHPVVYNTVFNKETIETLASGKDSEGLRRALHELHLTHIYVDWFEIQRHRKPGGYGFTNFVTPERFARWVQDGVLERERHFGENQELYRIR